MTPTLFTQEGLAGVLFLGFIATIIAGALTATLARNLIRCVSGLALCFLGVAGIYYYLNSPFIALMQLLIYVGAICVTIIFAIMLADNEKEEKSSNIMQLALSIITSAGIFSALYTIGCSSEWKPFAKITGEGTIDKIGQSLLTTYNLSFELISLVLLVAIIGSLVLARNGRNGK